MYLSTVLRRLDLALLCLLCLGLPGGGKGALKAGSDVAKDSWYDAGSAGEGGCIVLTGQLEKEKNHAKHTHTYCAPRRSSLR